MSEKEISKSKRKRLEMEKSRKMERRKKNIQTMWMILIPILILASVVAVVMYRKSQQINYSKYLTKEGTIANINIDDFVDNHFDEMSFSHDELMPSDDEITSTIDSMLEEHSALNTETTATTALGDKVNITYSASLNGAFYTEVTDATGGADILLEYGSSTIPDSYIDALVGKTPGDTFEADVEYPVDYEIAELAGQTLNYTFNIRGIYDVPEFNDEFVAAYYSDEAATAEEYRQKLVDDAYDSQLRSSIQQSLSVNFVVKATPDKYVANLDKIMENEYRTNYGMEDLSGVESFIHASSVQATETLLIYQSVFEKSGMTNTPDEVKAYLLDNGMTEPEYNSYVDTYGYEYVAQMAMQGRTLDYMVEHVKILE